MVTEEMIEARYADSVIGAGVRKIYKTQQDIVAKYKLVESGQLKHMIGKRPFKPLGDREYYMSTLTYLRFLDISYRSYMSDTRRGLAIYNRVIWGVLYGETMAKLRYGFTSEIKENIRKKLEQLENNVL